MSFPITAFNRGLVLLLKGSEFLSLKLEPIVTSMVPILLRNYNLVRPLHAFTIRDLLVEISVEWIDLLNLFCPELCYRQGSIGLLFSFDLSPS